jgi:hypothetical protein
LEHRVKYLGNVVQFYTRAGQAKRFNSSSHKLTFGCGFDSYGTCNNFTRYI